MAPSRLHKGIEVICVIHLCEWPFFFYWIKSSFVWAWEAQQHHLMFDPITSVNSRDVDVIFVTQWTCEAGNDSANEVKVSPSLRTLTI